MSTLAAAVTMRHLPPHPLALSPVAATSPSTCPACDVTPYASYSSHYGAGRETKDSYAARASWGHYLGFDTDPDVRSTSARGPANTD